MIVEKTKISKKGRRIPLAKANLIEYLENLARLKAD